MNNKRLIIFGTIILLTIVGVFLTINNESETIAENIIEANQSSCDGLCMKLANDAFNYDDCDEFKATSQALTYTSGSDCDAEFGTCTVTLRTGSSCPVTNEV